MARLGRLTSIAFLVVGVLVLVATSWARPRSPIAEQIAKTYGLDSFGQVEAIRYTFNLELFGKNISRSWVWQPKTGQVSYEGKDKDGKPMKVTYIESQLYEESAIVKDQVDPAFVNDNYWVIFPFHAYWDSPGADVQDKGMQKLPIGNGAAKLVSVKYSSKGGYTPGDTWDLYVGSDNRINEMVYHRGGPAKPSLVTVGWEGYKKAGPLLFSTDHRGTADGKPVRVSFSNVAVKLAGSDTWIDAQ
ncbi:MAG: hypothetical protein JO189_16820 [Deltaproteobacteria bacterium]|nr:hypothetical protein [Deltaproteobacteria bacterium]